MRGLPTHTERELLEQVASGNDKAFAALYHGYRPQVLSYLRRFLKSDPLSEDVCTEVFTRIWEGRSALTDVQSFKAYLFTAARNRVLTVLKQASRSDAALTEVARHFPQRSITAEEGLLDKEYIAYIQRSVEQLPPRAREVFRLCREEGYSYQEVARELGISRDAVKGHMVYSLKQIRFSLKKELGISFLLSLSILFKFFS